MSCIPANVRHFCSPFNPSFLPQFDYPFHLARLLDLGIEVARTLLVITRRWPPTGRAWWASSLTPSIARTHKRLSILIFTVNARPLLRLNLELSLLESRSRCGAKRRYFDIMYVNFVQIYLSPFIANLSYQGSTFTRPKKCKFYAQPGTTKMPVLCHGFDSELQLRFSRSRKILPITKSNEARHNLIQCSLTRCHTTLTTCSSNIRPSSLSFSIMFYSKPVY